MSDLISRQAAINAYGDWYVEEGTAEGFIGTVKQLLEGLPSAEPDQKWIPADNPPETDDYVLLSFENFSVPMVGRYEDCNYYVGDETEPLCKQDIFVNAWMPLPEPYKEGRTDA